MQRTHAHSTLRCRSQRLGALRDTYVALARLALPLAEVKGTLTPEAAAELRRLLESAAEGGIGTD
ncbi:MAG TPA: hypothetical protein VE258_19375, partial [Ktedonobacterales bacterium]|nr:hypothetical protein [Ktedonobacterales bacterium]